ncbi:chromosomal replication initiator DnaA [Brevundimonas sp. Root1423]|uniref:chromosomal replication initiator DnaA n=1 Tax=Brevundimonas sp. Root1423 TaxID=1736462 RepID=UPI0006FF949A|nr:chromosomal replication initiator DnaA [Brevundimonas sp. Root1423]KQY84789.1 chromosomal replication initiator DnaA [Brevundimonas sp. Root1423]
MNEAYRVPVTDEDRIRAGLAIQLVAAATGITAERMRAQTRMRGPECRARRLAMYLAYVTFGWPLERVAHAFGLNRATAAAACRWAEDERDRPTLDAMLDRLERCVREVLDAPVCEVPA